MESKELIKKLEIKRNQLSITERELKEIKRQYNALEKILVDGISFKADEVARAISCLILAKEEKMYIPVSGKYCKEESTDYYLTLVRAEELKEKGKTLPGMYDDQIVIYYGANPYINEHALKNHSFTFHHLLMKYSIGINGAKKRNLKPCVCQFEDREYVKCFITYLTELQIRNNGKHLTESDMLVAIANFINFEKEESKTKGLNRN